MTLGIRAHDMGMKDSLKEVAQSAKLLGFEAVQLVLQKAVKDAQYQAGELSVEYCRHIRETFAEQHVDLALLGAYFDWFHDDNGRGKAKFIDHLRHVSAMGSRIVATEVQGFRKDRWGHIPENETKEAMDLVLQTAAELAAAAEESGALVGIEGACSHVLSTPRKVVELTERVGTKNFALIFDLYNFLNQNNYGDQRNIIDEALDLYGEKLAVIHCKDFMPKKDHLKQVPLGAGLFDYSYLFKQIKRLDRDRLYLIFEGVTGEDIKTSRDFILSLLDI